MDFNQEMVGQPTDIDPWGTQSDGDGGDFNLFGRTPGAPNGEWHFELVADEGTADPMILSSMIASESETCVFEPLAPAPIPALNTWSRFTMLLLLAGLAVFTLRRRVMQTTA